jgi:hypothetical protein
MRSRAAIPLTVDARQVIAGLVYLVAYVALDRVSFSESYAQLGITPWSPSTGLSFVLILLFGRELIPLLFVALFLADMINRQVVLRTSARNRRITSAARSTCVNRWRVSRGSAA